MIFLFKSSSEGKKEGFGDQKFIRKTPKRVAKCNKKTCFMSKKVSMLK